MESPPAFQFYAKDHLATIELLTPEEAKAWIRLVCHAWLNDGTAPALLAARIATPEVLESLRLFTTQSEAGISFQWMDVLREKQAERRRVNAENGGKGGRGNKRGSKAKSERFTRSKQMQSEKKPSRAANAIEDSISTELEVKDESFERWWKLYGPRGSKKPALVLWRRMNPEDRLLCIERTPAYVASRPDRTFLKHGVKFLRDRSWEDEIDAAALSAPGPRYVIPAGGIPEPPML